MCNGAFPEGEEHFSLMFEHRIPPSLLFFFYRACDGTRFCGICSEKHCSKQIVVFSHSVVSDSFETPWTVVHEAPSVHVISGQEYWSGLLFPSPGDLHDPGVDRTSPGMAGGFFTTEPHGKTSKQINSSQIWQPVSLEPFTVVFSFILVRDVIPSPDMSLAGSRHWLSGFNPFFRRFVKSVLSHPLLTMAYISNNHFLSELLENIRFVQYYRALIFWSSKGTKGSRKQQYFLEIWVVMSFGMKTLFNLILLDGKLLNHGEEFFNWT